MKTLMILAALAFAGTASAASHGHGHGHGHGHNHGRRHHHHHGKNWHKHHHHHRGGGFVVIFNLSNVHGFCWEIATDDGTIFKGSGESTRASKAWRQVIKAADQLAKDEEIKDGSTIKVTMHWRGKKYVRILKVCSEPRREWPIWELER